MLWVWGYSYSAGIDFRRQNLTSKVYPRTERVKLEIETYFLDVE